MNTVRCESCGRDVPIVRGEYRVTGIVRAGRSWRNVYTCNSCLLAGDVAAAPSIDDLDDASVGAAPGAQLRML